MVLTKLKEHTNSNFIYIAGRSAGARTAQCRKKRSQSGARRKSITAAPSRVTPRPKPRANIVITEEQSDQSSSAASDSVEKKEASLTVVKFAQTTLQKGVAACKKEFMELRGFIPPDVTRTAFASNGTKNRYRDVQCYDATRVKLNNYTVDYIHANKVTGGNTEWICTQGPIDDTIADFWHMIWQEDVALIVMVCDVIENGRPKCAQYWPLEEGQTIKHGAITINCCKVIKQKFGANTVIFHNRMEIQLGDNAPRSVSHLHWPNWPDRGAPTDTKALLRVLDFVNRSSNGDPVVIHCSAGIGRTGSIVLTDICTRILDSSQPLDLANEFKKLRSQRASSVQTDIQYLFVYRVLLDYIFGKYASKSLQAEEYVSFKREYEQVVNA